MSLSSLEKMVDRSLKLLRHLLSMPKTQGVVDLEMREFEACHELACSSMHEIFISHHNQMARRFIHFFENWRELRAALKEGWDLALIRTKAQSCSLALLSLQPFLQAARQERDKEHETSFWHGDGLRTTLIRTLSLLEEDRVFALRSLFFILKRVLGTKPLHWKIRHIEVFFQTLSHYRFDLAQRLLELFAHEDSEQKDIALLIMISYGRATSEQKISLLKSFSSEDSRRLGVKTFFYSIYRVEPELAAKLVKKMDLRVMRNEALKDLSLFLGSQARMQEAYQYGDAITSYTLREEVFKTLKALEFEREEKKPINLT